MTELAVFCALVGLIAVAGIVLGMLAARRLDAWDGRRATAADAAAADAAAVAGVSGPAPDDDDDSEDGGETSD